MKNQPPPFNKQQATPPPPKSGQPMAQDKVQKQEHPQQPLNEETKKAQPAPAQKGGYAIPIRVKIIGIVALALLVSIVSFITVGRHLMIEDKTSYIYDFNLSRVHSAGNHLENRIKRTFEGGRAIIGSLTPGSSLLSLSLSALQQGWLSQLETELKIEGFLLLAPKGTLPGAQPLLDKADSPWEVITALTSNPEPATPTESKTEAKPPLDGTQAAPSSKSGSSKVRTSLETAFAQLGLSQSNVGAEPFQVRIIPLDPVSRTPGTQGSGAASSTNEEAPSAPGSGGSGRLGLFMKLGDDSQYQILFTQLKLNEDFFDPSKESRDMELRLIDSSGQTAARSSSQPSVITPKELGGLASLIGNLRFPSGVRDWKDSANDLMIGYRKIQGSSLLLLSLIPRNLAFAPAQTLSSRTLVLGLSILFLSIAATLLFIRGMISRLRELWVATQKVAGGNFDVRVQASQKRGDELADLATSFNTMADQIAVLMKATADKARMEKELETAQLLQSLFFPSSGYDNANFQLIGKFVPASECAGDWWQFAQSPDGQYLLIVAGDVTGHGVSAALVTAAIHGGFTLAVNELPYSQGPDAVLTKLLQELNSVVLNAAGGKATMTFVACLIDLRSGSLTLSNAGHLAPMLFRPQAQPTIKDFKSLVVKQGQALGAAPKIEVFTQQYQLSPSDRMIWYTDGLIEGPSAGRLSKTKFLKQILEVYARHPKITDEVCMDIIRTCYSDPHLLDSQLERPDDITVMIGSVPSSASWSKAPAPAETKGGDSSPASPTQAA